MAWRFSLIRILVSLIVWVGILQCTPDNKPAQIIREVGLQCVPDNRIGVYDIHFIQESGKLILRGVCDQEEVVSILITRLEGAGYAVKNELNLLPADKKYPWGIVSLSVINMRAAPGHDAEMITQALMGTPVRILKEDDDWLWVQTPDRYLSWCEKDALELKSRDDFEHWRQVKRVIVLPEVTFLRDTLNRGRVSDLVAGCILEELGRKGSMVWLKIPDGRIGMLPAEEVQDLNIWENQPTPEGRDLVSYAVKYMGIPYLWGGTSVKGMDCSGFVKTVYFLNGWILPRDADQQADCGKILPVDTFGLSYQPGDLLFFGTKSVKQDSLHITHVGMYKGDTEFIHSSGRVKVNSFDSHRLNYSHYRTVHLLKAVRLLGNEHAPGMVRIKDHPWY